MEVIVGNTGPLKDFSKAYKGLGRLAYLEFKNEDKSIFVRFFLPVLKLEIRKYIIALRIYNFGEFATLDFVSLNHLNYKRIAYDHIKRIGWPVKKRSVMLDGFRESCQAPYFIAGGVLLNKNNSYDLEDDLGPYGKMILGADVSDIGNFVFSNALGKRIASGNKALGLSFFLDLSSFMSENNFQADFYERLFDHYRLNGFEFSPQNVGALLAMKASDRKVRENGDFLSIICEEASMGIGAHVINKKKESD
jgi:hypothetical protein